MLITNFAQYGFTGGRENLKCGREKLKCWIVFLNTNDEEAREEKTLYYWTKRWFIKVVEAKIVGIHVMINLNASAYLFFLNLTFYKFNIFQKVIFSLLFIFFADLFSIWLLYPLLTIMKCAWAFFIDFVYKLFICKLLKHNNRT